MWFINRRTIIILALAMGCVASPTTAQEERPTWVRVTGDAPWQARDSQGELAYRDHLWIFGGWFNSYEAPPRDVWKSPDGRSWTRVTDAAPWIHSDLAMTIVFGDAMLIMGGWYNGRLEGHSASNQVWASTDGAAWKQLTDDAGWSPRIAAAVVVFRDRIWLLGGTENYYFGDESSAKNDVWSSADGRNWRLETAAAPWSPRAYHQAVVLDGKIYVMGGGNYVPDYTAHNDVWSSADGVHWEKVTQSTPWHPRLWFSSVVYRDRMWVLGGWSNHPAKNWGDAWHSRDGRQWSQLQAENAPKARHEHSAVVFNDRLWVVGGHAQPLANDVWSLELPADWSPGE